MIIVVKVLTEDPVAPLCGTTSILYLLQLSEEIFFFCRFEQLSTEHSNILQIALHVTLEIFRRLDIKLTFCRLSLRLNAAEISITE